MGLAEEVLAARRAPLVPHQEGAFSSYRVQNKPFVRAETLKACALPGLHLVAGEAESGFSSSSGVFSSELGGIPGVSGPKYPLWREVS